MYTVLTTCMCLILIIFQHVAIERKPQPADKDAVLHGFWICCKYLIVTECPCDGLSGLAVYGFDWMCQCVCVFVACVYYAICIL